MGLGEVEEEREHPWIDASGGHVAVARGEVDPIVVEHSLRERGAGLQDGGLDGVGADGSHVAGERLLLLVRRRRGRHLRRGQPRWACSPRCDAGELEPAEQRHAIGFGSLVLVALRLGRRELDGVGLGTRPDDAGEQERRRAEEPQEVGRGPGGFRLGEPHGTRLSSRERGLACPL